MGSKRPSVHPHPSSRASDLAWSDRPEVQHALFEASPDAIFIETLDGRVLECNRTACEMYGYTREEITSLTVADLVPAEFAPRLSEFVSELLSNGRAFTEAVNRRKDGTYFPVEVDARLITVGGERLGIVYVRDITSRQEVARALLKSEARYRTLVENLPIGVYRNTPGARGRYITANTTFLKMLGFESEAELQKIHVSDIYVDPALRKRFSDRLLAQGKVTGVEYQFKRKDGTRFWGSVTASVVYDEQGQPIYFDCTMEDVTARKEAEEQSRIRERFLESLSEISQLLLRAESLEEALPFILREVGETIGVSRAYLFENHLGPEGEILCSEKHEWCAPGVKPRIGEPEQQECPYITAGLARWAKVLSHGGTIGGIVAEFPAEERAALEPYNVRSLLVVPVIVLDEWYGFIGLDVCDQAHLWQQAEVDLLRAVAGDIASFIERQRILHRAQALQRATAALTSTLDLDQVLDRILEQVSRVVPSDAVNIMLIQGEEARIVRWSGYERFGSAEFVSTVTFHIPDVPNLRQMVESAEPLLIPDTATYPGWVNLPPQHWLRSYAAAPICVRGQVVGFLNADSHIPGFFTSAHLEALRGFADAAAAAITNARLFQAEQRQTRRLALLADVARVVVLMMDTDALLQAVADVIYLHFRYPAVFVFTPDENRQTMVLRGYSGLPDHGPEETHKPRIYRQPIEVGIVGYVARTAQPYLTRDAHNDPYHYSPPGVTVGSEVCVPILEEDRVVGVIDVESTKLADFDEQDRSLLEAVAATVTIGLRNACLQMETQRRMQEMTLLNRISLSFGTAPDVDQVINSALEGLEALVQADRTYFITADPDARTWETTHERTVPGIPSDIGLGGTFDDVAVELETALAGRPFAVDDIATDPHVAQMREVYLSLGMRSMLLVPVHIRGRLYGAVGFDFCREKHVWQPDEIRLLEGVAYQLGLVLENVRLFEQARQRANELAVALARLEELDRLKDEFIQNVSHELRSPLALIRGYAEMLVEGVLGPLSSEQQKPMEIIARRARMLGDLVEDITFILEAEANPPTPVGVPLAEIARAAVEDFQVSAGQAGLTLEASIPPSFPMVWGTMTHLRRLLDNLVSNAIKFTPAGGKVVVRLREEEEQVILEVSDTGIGIPPEEIDRIFDRFYQVDGSARRRYSGVGLGLALVKQIVTNFGGSVRVESQVGKGSTFFVTLPICREPPTPA